MEFTESSMSSSPLITSDMIEFFANEGYLVVPNVFSNREVQDIRNDLHRTMASLGVNHERINAAVARKLPRFGCQTQIFYPSWKLRIQVILYCIAILSTIIKFFVLS